MTEDEQTERTTSAPPPWLVRDVEFTPFADGGGAGLSADAICVCGGRTTSYQVSRYQRADETDDELRERIIAAIVSEINDPVRRVLIDGRFATPAPSAPAASPRPTRARRTPARP